MQSHLLENGHDQTGVKVKEGRSGAKADKLAQVFLLGDSGQVPSFPTHLIFPQALAPNFKEGHGPGRSCVEGTYSLRGEGNGNQ